MRPPSQVVVNAAGASPQRKEQIEAMLGNKPGIRLEFQEPFSDNSSNGAAAKATVIPGADQSRQIPDPLLIQYFGSSVAQENYTRSVLQASTDILAHLYALRELAGRWPPGSDERLSADAKAKLTAILRDHAKQLRMGMSTLKTDLQLILKDEQTTAQPIARAASGGRTPVPLVWTLLHAWMTLCAHCSPFRTRTCRWTRRFRSSSKALPTWNWPLTNWSNPCNDGPYVGNFSGVERDSFALS